VNGREMGNLSNATAANNPQACFLHSIVPPPSRRIAE
jgi:hypothetical protein